MARYFRCDEPTLQCPHARTRAVQLEHAGVCPIDNPDCERYRRSVPLLTALWERHPGRIVAGVGLLGLVLVALLLSAVLDGGGWKADLADFQAELDALERRLSNLDTQPARPAIAAADLPALERLEEHAQRFKQSVDQAVAANAAKEEVSRLQAEGESLERRLAERPGAAGPDPEAVRRQGEAQQLVRDYTGLEERAETSRTGASPGDETGQQAFSDLIEQVRDGMRRASRLAAPVPTTPLPGDAALIARIQANLASNRAALDQLASKSRPPFPPADAGLAIAASPTLVESLVLPLLEARFGGALTAEPDAQRWFIPSTDPAIAPGAVVTVTADDPYGPLLDGSADLVLTDQAADAAVRASFAQAFRGKELDSRAFSEVVALDAVALLAHPNAAGAPVDLANLSHGTPWLVRADDADRIRRLTAGAVPMEEVQDPFQPLLTTNTARALVLYHQCAPNLPAKYLPFQPAPDVRALAPSPFSIATEDYRLAFRIIAAHSPLARPAARQFIDYLTSDPGQDRIAAAGFVDLRLRHRQEAVAPEILAALAKALARASITSASRYSANLRFGVNEHELDIKSQADLGRLPRSLAQEFPDAKVVILGFTDNTGPVAINVPLSIERAQTIAAELHKFGIGAAAAGLGQQFPVDSNDTNEGRARNRRAEVWVVQH